MNMRRMDPAAAPTLPHSIAIHAHLNPERIAVSYLDDNQGERSWTFGQLWLQACRVAKSLPPADQSTADAEGPRGLLLFPPGIDFLAGFLGCQIAGWIPVPTCYPKAGRKLPRLDAAARDCSPSALICDRRTTDQLDDAHLSEPARSIPRVIVDSDSEVSAGGSDWLEPETLATSADQIALLQYTSGSTSDPKGVMVRHRNLMANLEAIRHGFRIDWQHNSDTPKCGVFWLPFFHDMGLIGAILEPLYLGGRTILISPRAFLQRPVRWLECISDYGASFSGAPNFAYQMCVDRIPPQQADQLDLSCWQIAFCGAEPISSRTLVDFSNRFSAYGFSPDSFYPCYGLAEATLLAAGGDGPGEPNVVQVDRESLARGTPEVVQQARGRQFQSLVSCGKAAQDTELLIVDVESSERVGECVVGEIWLRGPGVTEGYWNRSDENRAQFNAKLAGELSQSEPSTGYLRTGDLGFIHQGQLYVTGRCKDVIILRGRNLFPQDIEATVRDTIGPDAGLCAAVSVEGVRGEALAIVAELPRRSDESTLQALAREIRRNVIETHEVDPSHVLLVRQATIPLTSSGKIQRNRCRELLQSDEIKYKFRYDRSSASQQSPIPLPQLPIMPTADDRQSMADAAESWMTQWLVTRAGVHPKDVEPERPFSEYGLDSVTAVEMSGEIEDWSGVELNPVVAWNYPTVSQLSGFIIDQLIEKPKAGIASAAR